MAELMEWEPTSSSGAVPTLGIVDGHDSEETLTAKDVMDMIMMDVDIDVETCKSTEVQLFVVPDTNIFVHKLDVVRHLLNHEYQNLNLAVILPWTVLQELDGLRKRNSGAQAAINYINQLLVEKHPKLRPQRPSEVALSKEEFVGSNEDDTILQCALHWCGKVKSNTLFVTDDKNLRSKAMVVNPGSLTVSDGGSALAKIQQMPLDKGSTPELHDTYERRKSAKKSNSCSSSSSIKPKPKRELITRPPPSKLSKPNKTVEVPRKRRRSPSRTSVPVESRQASSLPFSPIRKKTIKESPKIIKCDSFEDALKLLRDVISLVIEFQMKEDFGEHWKNCLKIPPPWSVETGLKCLLAHWIAVFSYVFGRAKGETEKLYEAVRKYNRSIKGRSPQVPVGIEEDILELSVALFNAAEKNKSKVIQEAQVVQYKKAILDYLSNQKSPSSR